MSQLFPGKDIRFYPPFLPFSLGAPLFTGVRRREGKQMSLPCLKRPVHRYLRGVTGGREGKIAISNSTKVIFVTFGVFKFLFGVILNTLGETISISYIGCKSPVPMASFFYLVGRGNKKWPSLLFCE